MSDLLNSASLVMIPSGYKEDIVYSQIPTDGSADLAFTRASNGTRVNSAGLVEVCPWNLVQYSEDFTNAAYTNIDVTVTANNTTAPNGTTTADKLQFTTNSSFIYQANNGTNSATGCISVYLKADANTQIYIASNDLVTWGTGVQLLCNVTTEWQRFEIGGNGSNVNAFKSWVIGTVNPSTGGAGLSSRTIYAWGAQVNIGSTAKPYFPTTDRLNVPRLTYQNGGGGCPSLLLEKQSTNLILQSEAFDSASWAPFTTGSGAVNRIANAATSPDGTTNADEIQLTRSALTDAALLYQQQYASNATYSRTIYLKAARSQDVGKKIDIWSYDGSSVLNPISPTLTADWQRIDAGTATGALVEILSFGYLSSNTLPTTSGTDVRFYAWGAQGEASSYPTSYIPTTSSSATRVADACYKTGISSLIGQTEGTLFVDFDLKSTANTGTYDSIINIATDANNSIDIVKNNTTSELYVFAINGGVIQVNSTGISGTNIQGKHKIAIGYKLNDYVCYLDGVQVFTDTSATVPACSNLYLGAYLGTANQIGGSIYQAVLFKTRLTNSELASLTTI